MAQTIAQYETQRKRRHRANSVPSPETIANRAADWYLDQMQREIPVTVYYWQFDKPRTMAARYYKRLLLRLDGRYQRGQCHWHMLKWSDHHE